jgi:hypothetical protein
MTMTHHSENIPVDDLKYCSGRRFRFRRALLATAASLSLGLQDVAWASCADGSGLPAGGYVLGRDFPNPANWSPHIYSGTIESLWIPDTSVNEFNDPSQPVTSGGHNWVFDQGTTLCKATNTGPAGQLPTGWAFPTNLPMSWPGTSSCALLPGVSNGAFVSILGDAGVIGDIPRQGDVITPTCDPSKLSTASTPNPANTYFNQLGCSISRGQATTPQVATSFLFVAGITGGLFSIPLANAANPVAGGDAGKVLGVQNYYSAIPEKQKLTHASVSPDGRFAIATSRKQLQPVFACLNPLGDPGDPSKPINLNFSVPPSSSVKCMQVGNNALAADLTTEFGPDNQPYFGGRRVVNSFDAQPGGLSRGAWPNCIWQNNGSASLADAFASKRANGCGNAFANTGFAQAGVTQPQILIRHATNYMYTAPPGGMVVQVKVTVGSDGLSRYQARTYATGFSVVTGLGVAEDLQSIMVFTDPSLVEARQQEVVTRLPLCEDM